VDVDLLETWSNAFYPGTLGLPQFLLLLDYVTPIFYEVGGCVFVGYVLYISLSFVEEKPFCRLGSLISPQSNE
jgi:hypothetical protein